MAFQASLVAQTVKNTPAMQEMQERRVQSLGWEHPLEKGIGTTPVFWRIPWTKESGRLQSIELQTVGHDWATKHVCPRTHTHTHTHTHTLTEQSRTGFWVEFCCWLATSSSCYKVQMRLCTYQFALYLAHSKLLIYSCCYNATLTRIVIIERERMLFCCKWLIGSWS